MQIRVLLFAGLAESAGSPALDLQIDATEAAKGFTVASLCQLLEQQLPGLANSAYRVAIDQQYVGDDQLVQTGQEIALIPPVSGG